MAIYRLDNLYRLAYEQIHSNMENVRGRAIGQVFEYGDEALASLSTDERATLTNMVAEIGGFSGIIAPDEETQRFLRELRGIEFEVEPWMHSDDDAEVAHTIDVDCSQLEPMLARPGDPGQGIGL